MRHITLKLNIEDSISIRESMTIQRYSNLSKVPYAEWLKFYLSQ